MERLPSEVRSRSEQVDVVLQNEAREAIEGQGPLKGVLPGRMARRHISATCRCHYGTYWAPAPPGCTGSVGAIASDQKLGRRCDAKWRAL